MKLKQSIFVSVGENPVVARGPRLFVNSFRNILFVLGLVFTLVLFLAGCSRYSNRGDDNGQLALNGHDQETSSVEESADAKEEFNLAEESSTASDSGEENAGEDNPAILDTGSIETDISQNTKSSEENQMKLWINDKEIPVIWEKNKTVEELQKEAAKEPIVVEMSMYSDNEQVGPLGRRYSSNDRQTTTHNGDIVLYNSSNIVVFYGSNSWAYTRLGKMDLPENDVIDLLSGGDVRITIK